MSSEVLRARSALGVATRLDDDDRVTTARRDLAAAKIRQYIERTISSAPPLSPEQRDSLAALIRTTAVR